MQKHRVLLFFVSLLVAIIAWIYVVTTVAPDTTGTVSGIGVSVIGDTTLEARGLMITEMDTSAVRVELQTSRATLSKLNSGNMGATVDVSRITEAGEYDLSYAVSFPDTVNTGEIQLLRKSVDKIHVTVCNLVTKTIPMELKWSGQVPDGYLFDEGKVEFSPETLTLQGPDFEVNSIAKAVATFDVSGLTETVVQQQAPIFLDELGNEVVLSEVTEVSAGEVTMTVPVMRYKDIRLAVDLLYGAGINSDNVKVTLDPESIRVSGDSDIIGALGDSITLGSIDLTQAENNDTFPFQLQMYLPKGVTNVSGEPLVTATVAFTGLAVRTFTVTDIELLNEPEDYEVVLSTRAVSVRLRGSQELLDTISAEQIHVRADLADMEQSGTYTVVASVEIDGKPDVGVVRDVELIITLS